MKLFNKTFHIMSLLVIALLVCTALILTLSNAEGSESSVTKGQTSSGYIRLKSTTAPNGTVTTKGYINNRDVRLKTKPTTSGSTTRGWVGGEYIRTKTKVKKD